MTAEKKVPDSKSKTKKLSYCAYLLAAFCIGFIINDVIVSRVLKFPTYGAEKFVSYTPGRDPWGDRLWTPIWKPYALHYTKEGRRVTRANNYGLPGIDIKYVKNPIVILGSSFVMGFECPADSGATSLFQNELNHSGNDATVYNLGGIHHDPYSSWCRLNYYKQNMDISPKTVILVLEQGFYNWMKPFPKPLDLDYRDYREKSINLTSFTSFYLSKVFSYCNLVEKGIAPHEWSKQLLLAPYYISRKFRAVLRIAMGQNANIYGDDKISQGLLDVLLAFRDAYPHFIIVSISSNNTMNNQLSSFCSSHQIRFSQESILKPEYRFFGKGHLNEQGHQRLAKLLMKSYTSVN